MYYWNNSTSALFPFVTFRSMYATCGMCGTTLQHSSSTISLWADCGNFLSVCFHYKNCEQDMEALYNTGKNKVSQIISSLTIWIQSCFVVMAAAVDDIVVVVDTRNLCLMFGQNQVM